MDGDICSRLKFVRLFPTGQNMTQGVAAMAEQGDEESHSSNLPESDRDRSGGNGNGSRGEAAGGGGGRDAAGGSSSTGGGGRSRRSSTALQGRLSHEGSGRSKVKLRLLNIRKLSVLYVLLADCTSRSHALHVLYDRPQA